MAGVGSWAEHWELGTWKEEYADGVCGWKAGVSP